jgi:hypothetical protein
MKNRKIHKSGIIFLLSALISTAASAQADSLNNPDQFLLSKFSIGIVKMKDGEKVTLNLNYNIITEKMVFMQNKQIFDIVNYGAIDTVYLKGGRFIPHGRVFYEVIVNGRSSFFIQNKGTMKNPSKPAAYGGTSEVSSSTYINNLRVGGDVYRKDHKADVVIYEAPIYWISKDGEMFIVTGRKSMLNIYADKKSEVRGYMNRTNFDPEDPASIKNLVIYYNSLFL